jgi:hypothetical protein
MTAVMSNSTVKRVLLALAAAAAVAVAASGHAALLPFTMKAMSFMLPCAVQVAP